MEVDIALEMDRAGMKNAGRDDDASASGNVTRFDGFADGFGVIGAGVGTRAISR